MSIKQIFINKKYSSLFFYIFLVIQFISCSSAGIKDYSREGWIDDDTYQIRATGYPLQRLKDVEARKRSSLDSALLMADKRVLETIHSGLNNEGCDDYLYPGCVYPEQMDKVKEALRTKKIITTKYNQDQSCEILVRIYKKNFKKEIGWWRDYVHSAE